MKVSLNFMCPRVQVLLKSNNLTAQLHRNMQSDFALDYIVGVWVNKYTDAYNMKLKVTDVIYNALNDAVIGIPFHTRTIFTKTID